jgi:hypothetical protein
LISWRWYFATSAGFSQRGVAGLREDPRRGGNKVYEIVVMGEGIVRSLPSGFAD